MLTSPEIARHAPLLRMAAPFVAHPAIRNKGTFGGSIALADPAAEFPAMTLALDAEIEIAGPQGVRAVPATEFFQGLFETALDAGEIITAIHIPQFGANERCVFDEYARRRGDYAMVGAGIKAAFDGEQVEHLRIAFLAVGPTPLRAHHAEAAITGRTLSAGTIADAQSALASDLAPDDTSETSAETRMHLARVLLGRLLVRLRDGTPIHEGATS
jgi:carbon-monoxide dehydrogenase medium subunit